MANRIPDFFRSRVIQEWLMGRSRDDIAKDLQISGGTVTNIIDQFRAFIGYYEVFSLREMGKALKKANMSPLDCLQALRIANICNELDIKEDSLYSFLTATYIECQNQGLSPNMLIKDLTNLKQVSEIESLLEIPEYIKRGSEEIKSLKKEIASLKSEKENLLDEIQSNRKRSELIKANVDSLNNKYLDLDKDLLLFRSLKQELEKNNIPIVAIESLISVIKIFREDFKFDPLKILCEFSDIRNYPVLRDKRIKEENEHNLHLQDLKVVIQATEKEIESNQLKLQMITDLENMNFTLADLERIFSYIQELAEVYRNLDRDKLKMFSLEY